MRIWVELIMIYVIGPRGRLASVFQLFLLKKSIDFRMIDTEKAFEIYGLNPEDCVINFAARGVRSDKRGGFTSEFKRINVELPEELSKKCLEAGAHLIHFSSELELFQTSNDVYVSSKASATSKILQSATVGLDVACLSLPSIVGFMGDPGYVEKVVLDRIANDNHSGNLAQFNRGMLHKFDFSSLLYDLVTNRWISTEIIKIDPITYLTSELFEFEIAANLRNPNKQGSQFDWSTENFSTFRNSTIKFNPMTASQLTSMLVAEALEFRAI